MLPFRVDGHIILHRLDQKQQYAVDDLIMLHLNYASKLNFVGSKFRANFLIMRRRPRAYAHIMRAHCQLAIAATATGIINHAVYQIECCIRGYHVNHRIWHSIIGEVLGTTRELENEHDRYAVVVLEEKTWYGRTLTSSNKPRVLLLFENRRHDHYGGNRTTMAFRPPILLLILIYNTCMCIC